LIGTWDYYAAYIAWNEKSHQWEVTESEEDILPQGLHVQRRLSEVLNAFGQAGWELITVNPEYWYGPLDLNSHVTVYRAFLKRKMGA
jgi:hypothetical protein